MAYTGTFPNIQYSNASGTIKLVTEVRNLLNEPVALQFTDTQIQYWLDRGAVEAARITKCNENKNPASDQAYITILTGTTTYNLTTEMFAFADAGNMYDYELDIEAVFMCNAATATPQTESSGWTLAKIHPRHIKHLSADATGAPQVWCRLDESPYAGVHDHQIFIWPAPTSTYNNCIAEILYRVVPVTLKATDTGSADDVHYLPEVLREDPIYYAVAQGFKKKKMYSIAEMYEQIFRNVVMFHRQDLYEKPIDSADMMVQPDFTQIQQ